MDNADITPTVEAVLSDPSASFALKAVVRVWLVRDPVDAAQDAACLAQVLDRRAKGFASCP